MRKRSYKQLVFLGLALFFLFTLSPTLVKRMRKTAVTTAGKVMAKPKGGEKLEAQVVFRDPVSWGGTLWVKVEGAEKSSPVVVDNAVVGVVDQVGKGQARVRLLTDPGLKIAVRAVRGELQNALLIERLEGVIRSLAARTDLPLGQERRIELVHELNRLKGELSQVSGGKFLAKGLLQGASASLWRCAGASLEGTGFNYAFADEKGGPFELSNDILQVGDLLVTTGMDGVFPPGLQVAEVRRVHPLEEGAFAYSLEAVPVVPHFDSLSSLTILPPVGFLPEL